MPPSSNFSSTLGRFFDLYDEYQRRQPRLVAKVREDRRECTGLHKRTPEGAFVSFVEMLPKSLSIVVYTNDPGFFVAANKDGLVYNRGGFYPTLADIAWQPWSPSDRFEILDQRTWDRLIAASGKGTLGWTPRLRKLNKTLFAVRCKFVDRQDLYSILGTADEGEAGSGGDRPAEE